MSILFPLLPYFWVLLFVGALLAVIVAALKSRPKKPKADKPAKVKPAKAKKEKKGKKKKKGEPDEEEAPADEFGAQEPLVEFEDEFSQPQGR